MKKIASYRSVVPTQILDSERDDAVNLDSIALDRFAVSGNKRLTH